MTSTTTQASPAVRSTARPCGGCSATSKPAASTRSSATGSTGSRRSLTDFAKLVEIFDRHSRSRWSASPSTSTRRPRIGRLNLHMILSFAQYERELAGERIRDKVRTQAGARACGWAGTRRWATTCGTASSSSTSPRRALVRHIFERFLQVGSATKLVQELNAAGHRTKRGKPFDKGVVVQAAQQPRPMSARSSTRAPPTRASTRPSSTATPGTRSTRSSPRTRTGAPAARARRRLRCSRA